ncbi:MAG: protein kinase [Myxococcales bacterium]
MSRQGSGDIPPGGAAANVDGADGSNGATPRDRPNTTIKFGVSPVQSEPPGVLPRQEGEVVGYGLGARLGPSGDVYEARSPRFGDRVAMKLYRRATGVSAAVAHAFANDAAWASSLRHPHIVQVIEAGTLRDGTPFATTEYLVGHTLEERLEGRGAFLATELLPLIRGTASALSVAHAAGLVHRELRPDNLFILDLAGYESGFVKVLDFGACHLTAAEVAAGREVGSRTTRYLAPEQMGGARIDDVDARADQFALAAIAYRMLSGTDPPLSNGRGAPGRPGAMVMPLSRRAPAVDAVVSKALSRVPEDRFESVALFLRAFEEALAGAALIATPGPVRVDKVTPGGGRPMAMPRATTTTKANTTATVQPGPTVASIKEIAPLRDRRGGFPRRDPTVELPSLTQQFFEEGDRQESTRYKGTPVDDSDFSTSRDFDSFDRIPTRRGPLMVAILLLLVAGGGVAWWAGIRPPQSWRESSLWQRLHLPTLSDGFGEAPPAALPAAEPALAPPPEITRAAAGAERVVPTANGGPVQPGSTIDPTAVAAGPGDPADQARAAAAAAAGPRNTAAPHSPVPATPPLAQPDNTPTDASPVPAQPAAASPLGARPPERTERVSGDAPHPALRKAPRAPVVRAPVRARTPALRGYTWSPEQNSVVPSERDGSQPWPPPSSEPPSGRSSGAPPAWPSAPASSAAAPPPFNP